MFQLTWCVCPARVAVAGSVVPGVITHGGQVYTSWSLTGGSVSRQEGQLLCGEEEVCSEHERPQVPSRHSGTGRALAALPAS